MKTLFAVSVAAMMISTSAFADDGSCSGFDTVTAIELKMCVDLDKGPTSRDAQVARKLIENGNASWSADGRDGTCRMHANARGTIGGDSHIIRASCKVSDPQALRACVEKAHYASDVTRCGLKYLTK